MSQKVTKATRLRQRAQTRHATLQLDDDAASVHLSAMVTLIESKQKFRHPEKRNRPDTPVLRKPDWIRVKAPVSPGFHETHEIVRSKGLVTVCQEAGCHNDDSGRGLHTRLLVL